MRNWIGFVWLLGLALAQTRGGELRVAVLAEPPVLDPTASTSQEIARMLYDNVLQGLVKFNEKGEIVPALAERWQGSPSSLTWTFYLRKGVRFHNGQPFTAEDVLFKFNRAKDPRSGHTHPEYYREIVAVEVKDPHTVVFRLRQPDQDFLFNLARPDSVIGPKGRVEEQRTSPSGPALSASWPGSGGWGCGWSALRDTTSPASPIWTGSSSASSPTQTPRSPPSGPGTSR
jgi:peptide/nickel transport system substrate-binding protein